MSEGTYTQHLEKFEDTLEKFNQVLQKQGSDIADIKQALLGNDYGEEGLVIKVKTNDERLKDLEEFKNKIVWISIGVSAGSGGGIAALVQWLL